MSPRNPFTIALAPYPTFDDGREDTFVEHEFELLQSVVEALRAIRKEYGIPDHQACSFRISSNNADTCSFLTKHMSVITTFFPKLDEAPIVENNGAREAGFASTIVSSDTGTIEIFVALRGLITREAEFERIDSKIKKVDKDLSILEKKMSAKDFMERAPKEVVEETLRLRSRCEEMKARLLTARTFAEELESAKEKERHTLN